MTQRGELILWAAGITGNLTLFCVLLAKKHWPRYPIFTSLAGFEVLRTVLLFYVSRHGTHFQYLLAYWTSDAIDVLLQLLLLWEIAVGVFGYLPLIKGLGISARIPVLHIALAFLIAGLCPLLLSAPSIKDTIDMRASIFTSIITCELYVLIARRANMMALRRTENILAITNGITFWSIISILCAAIQEIRGWEKQSKLFDEIRACAVIIMLAYWVQHFLLSGWANRLVSRPYSWLPAGFVRRLNGFSKST